MSGGGFSSFFARPWVTNISLEWPGLIFRAGLIRTPLWDLTWPIKTPNMLPGKPPPGEVRVRLSAIGENV